MKKYFILFLCAFFCAHSITIIAQSQDKVVKVKVKSASGDNDVQLKTEGDAKVIFVDEDQRELKLNAKDFMVAEAGEDSDKKVTVDVQSEVIDGVEKRTVTVSIEEAGKTRIIKWEDDGKNIPADIQAQLDAEEVELNITEGKEDEKTVDVEVEKEMVDGEEKRNVKVTVTEGGKDMVLEWEDNGEIPAKVKERLEHEGVDVNIINANEDSGNVESEEIKKDGNKETVIKKEIKSKYKIVDNSADGDKKVIEWDGEGEMPADMKKVLDEEGIQLSEFTIEEDSAKKKVKVTTIKKSVDEKDRTETKETKKIKIKVLDGNGKEKILEWDGEGEMPPEMKKLMEEHGHDVHKKGTKKHNKDHGNLYRGHDFFLGEKPLLGIILRASEEGVLVEEVVPNSAAAKIGLQTDDIITGIDNIDVTSVEHLQEVISTYEVGDEVAVHFIRNEKSFEANAVLKGQKSKAMSGCCSTSSNNFCGQPKTQSTYLGVMISEVNDIVTVDAIVDDSPAEKAGLEANDIIVQIDDYKVESIVGLQNRIASYDPGEKVEVVYIRGSEEVKVKATLGPTTMKSKKVKQEKKMYKCGDNFSGDEDIDVLFQKLDDNPRDHEIVLLTEAQKEMLAWERSQQETEVRVKEIPTTQKLELKSFKAFPNPTDAIVNISFEGDPSPTILQLVDMNGRQIYKETLNDFSGSYANDIDLSSSMRGQYFVYIIQNQKLYSEIIVLQ